MDPDVESQMDNLLTYLYLICDIVNIMILSNCKRLIRLLNIQTNDYFQFLLSSIEFLDSPQN